MGKSEHDETSDNGEANAARQTADRQADAYFYFLLSLLLLDILSLSFCLAVAGVSFFFMSYVRLILLIFFPLRFASVCYVCVYVL
jgi:hypothetical protein